jgi:hypothetical protein
LTVTKQLILQHFLQFVVDSVANVDYALSILKREGSENDTRRTFTALPRCNRVRQAGHDSIKDRLATDDEPLDDATVLAAIRVMSRMSATIVAM